MTKRPLADIFRESAGDYRRAFPQELEKLLVTARRRIVYATPEVAEIVLTVPVAKTKKLIRERLRFMSARDYQGACGYERLNRQLISYVSLDDNALARSLTKKKKILFTFDHEIGHAIDMFFRISPGHFGECVADAFAALRQIQRFGTLKTMLEFETGLVDTPDHYTIAVIQKVADIHAAKETDIRRLSLRDTFILACIISGEYALDLDTHDKLYSAFARARQYCRQRRLDQKKILREVARVMLKNKDDHDIYRVGKLYITLAENKKVIRKDAALRKAFAFTTPHEKESDFILNPASALDAKRGFKPRLFV